MKIISGSSNPKLADKLAAELNIPVIDRDITRFKNNELRVKIKEDIIGENIVLVQSLSDSVDSHVVETLLIIDALERLGVRHVYLIMPWMGYSLQDKVFKKGEPISAKVIAKVISSMYVKRVTLLDLHNSSIPAFFSVPTDHITAMDTFINYMHENDLIANGVVVSPDFGGLKKARTLADKLQINLVNIDKDRDLKTGKVTTVDLHGDVTGKNALILDDVINSGSTVIEASKMLKKKGAQTVYFMATHGIFCNGGLKKIAQSQVDKVVVTNSIPVDFSDLTDEERQKYQVLDISPIFAKKLKKWL